MWTQLRSGCVLHDIVRSTSDYDEDGWLRSGQRDLELQQRLEYQHGMPAWIEYQQEDSDGR